MTQSTHLPTATGVSHPGVWPHRIGRRLALGFAMLVALMLVALCYVGWQLHAVSEITRQFAYGDMQRLLRVQQLGIQTEGVGTPMVRLMNASRDKRTAEYAEIDSRSHTIDNIMESLSNDLKDAGQEETLGRLKKSRADYQAAYLLTAEAVEAGDREAAIYASLASDAPRVQCAAGSGKGAYTEPTGRGSGKFSQSLALDDRPFGCCGVTGRLAGLAHHS
jgi:hypothetical protein